MPSTVVGVGSEAEEAVVLLTAPPRPISRVATVVRASAPGEAEAARRRRPARRDCIVGGCGAGRLRGGTGRGGTGRCEGGGCGWGWGWGCGCGRVSVSVSVGVGVSGDMWRWRWRRRWGKRTGKGRLPWGGEVKQGGGTERNGPIRGFRGTPSRYGATYAVSVREEFLAGESLFPVLVPVWGAAEGGGGCGGLWAAGAARGYMHIRERIIVFILPTLVLASSMISAAGYPGR